jgi:hypothetical protein
LVGGVAEQRLDIALRDVGEMFGHHRGGGARGAGQIAREVDVIVGRRRRGHQGRRGVAQAVADIGAAPDLAGDQAASFRFGIGARDRADGEVQLPGEIAMGGQAIARLQPPRRDIGGEGIGDRDVAGAGAGFDLGLPSCHRDNVIIDLVLCQ